ncbi:ribonuclease H-like domain-containing protein [Tanacetum coccineum]
MWLFHHKYLANDTLSRYKDRLVANGSMQLEGIDVDETQGTNTAYLLLYLDDIVLTASFKALLQQIIASLHKEFCMTNLGSLNYFLVNCNLSRTPVDTESKLGDDGDLVSDPTFYRSLAGSLQYLTFARPDIFCILFLSSTTSLVAYSDADWAGCPTTRRSTSEAEYCGVANVVDETCWLRNLLLELHTSLSFATLVYYDNVSFVFLSSNSVQHQCTKHIEIDIHFIRDLVTAGQVRVLHVPSRYQYANIFTKGFPLALFEEFRTSLSVRCPPAQTVGEC